MERAPRILKRGRERGGVQLRRGLAGGLEQRRGALVVGEGFAVAGVQPRLRLLQRVAGESVGLGVVREGGPGGLRSHDRVMFDRVERALPGVRRLARGARAAGSRYVGRGYAPDITRTSKTVGEVAPTYEFKIGRAH